MSAIPINNYIAHLLMDREMWRTVNWLPHDDNGAIGVVGERQNRSRTRPAQNLPIPPQDYGISNMIDACLENDLDRSLALVQGALDSVSASAGRDMRDTAAGWPLNTRNQAKQDTTITQGHRQRI